MQKGQPLNILVADDHFGSAVMTTEVLQHLGHRTRTASGGQEAIRVAVIEQPDVIFMDVHMPDLGGYEAAKRIKTLLPSVRVVAMSGMPPVEHEEPSGFVVFDARLDKPFKPDQVRKVLADLFAGG